MRHQRFLNCGCDSADVAEAEATEPGLASGSVSGSALAAPTCPCCQNPARGYLFRAELVEWLFELAGTMAFQSTTLHTAVRYVDSVLSVATVRRSKLQLVGVACLVLAAKYEEIEAISVDSFVALCARLYTRHEIIRMESQVLALLQFEMRVETVFPLVSSFVGMVGASKTAQQYAAFMADVLLLDGVLSLAFTPMQLAAAAVVLAQDTCSELVWDDTLVSNLTHERIKPDVLRRVCRRLHAAMRVLDTFDVAEPSLNVFRYAGSVLVKYDRDAQNCVLDHAPDIPEY